jgi:hypothetical protein
MALAVTVALLVATAVAAVVRVNVAPRALTALEP